MTAGRRAWVWLLGALVVLAATAFGSVARAQNVNVVMTTTTAAPTVGQRFELQVRADATGGQVQNVRLPDLSAFDVLGRSVSMPMRLGIDPATGRQVFNSSHVTTVSLRAVNPGRVRLAPATAVVNGQHYESNPVEITIGGSAQPGAQPQQPPGLSGGPPGQPAPPPGSLTGANPDATAFLRTVVSPERAYVGQQVVVTLYLYARGGVQPPNITREITTPGLWVHDLLPPSRRWRAASRQNVGGVPYQVYVLRQFAAFPQEAGELTLGAPTAQIRVGGRSFFAQPQTINRTGMPVTLEALELPEPRPDGAVVGRYDVTASLDRTTVATGDALTVRLRIEGQGNLRDLHPRLPEIDGLRILQPRTEDQMQLMNSQVRGIRTVEWLIVPQRPGRYTIPPIEIPVFDPERERYATETTTPLVFDAQGAAVAPATTPSPSGAADADEPADAAAADAPVGELRPRSALLRGTARWSSHPAYLPALLAMPMLYVLVLLLGAWRRRAQAGAQRPDRIKAARAREKLAEADNAMRSGDAGAFYAAVAGAIRAGLEGRLGDALGSLTHSQLDAHLHGRGVPDDLRQRVVDELEGCDFARFSSDASGAEEMGRAMERVRALLKRLERFSPPEADAEVGA